MIGVHLDGRRILGGLDFDACGGRLTFRLEFVGNPAGQGHRVYRLRLRGRGVRKGPQFRDDVADAVGLVDDGLKHVAVRGIALAGRELLRGR